MRNGRWIIAFVVGLPAFWGGASAARWEVGADIPHSVYGHGAAVVGDRLYVIGGCETADWTKTSTRLQIYDSTRDSWTTGADLPVGLGWPMVAVYADKIYVFGGSRPVGDEWTKLDVPRLQQRLFFLTQSTSSAYHGEKLLVVGGQSHYRRTNTAAYFDMKREIFVAIPTLPDARCCGGGGVVGDALMLAGGFWGVGETNDPAHPTWLLNVADLPDPDPDP
jgi:hypothetical protein